MIKSIVTTVFLCLCVIAGAVPELIFQSDFTKAAPPFRVWGKLKDGMLSSNGRYDFGGIILNPSEQALTVRCTLKCDPGTSLGIVLFKVKNNSTGEKLGTVVWDTVKPMTEQTFSWKLDPSLLKEKSFLVFYCINPKKGDLTIKEIQIEKIPDPQPQFGTQKLVFQSNFMENKPPFLVWGKPQDGMLNSNGQYAFGGIILPPSNQSLTVTCTLKCDPGTIFGICLFNVKNSSPGQLLSRVTWNEFKPISFQTSTWKINPVYLNEETFLVFYCINPKYGNLTVKDIRIERVADVLEIPLLKKTPSLNEPFGKREADNMLHLVDFLKYPVDGHIPATDATEVFLGMTPQILYGIVVLHHPRLDKLKNGVYPRDDLRVFKDDSIEFFISAPGRVQPYFQFAFNAAGSLYDAMCMMKNWDSGFRSNSMPLGKHCTAIRFELPLKDIGYNEVDRNALPANWGVNFNRNHSTGEHSTWGPIGLSFHAPAQFKRFKGFGTLPGIVAISTHFPDTEAAQDFPDSSFWKNEKTLYSELFTDQDSPLKGHGAYIWLAPLDTKTNTLFGLQYGAKYSKEEMLEEFRKHHVHPFCRYGDIPHYADWAKKTGVGLAVYFRYYRSDSFAWDLSDDATMKRKLNELDALLTKYPGTIWGISLGDEVLEILLQQELIDRVGWNGYPGADEMQRIKNLIRTQYGYGKYDLPKSIYAKDQPFHRLAARRFVLSKMQMMQKGIWEICQKHRGPDGKKIVSISASQRGDNIMQDHSRFTEWCDLFTTQVVPATNPWRQNITFVTKLMHDLTNKPVFPSVHLEHYQNSHDNETTSAFMSEILRGGGRGMQLWLFDWAGHLLKMGSSSFDYYGHRPRWNTIMEQASRFRTMKQLRFPNPEYAVFLSNDSSFAIENFPESRCEWLFNLIGPGAGSSFRFISDTQLIDGKIRLKNFPLVLLPAAPIQSKAVQQKFEEYIKNGGMLVCFDPHVFDYADDGSSTSEFREQLFGVKTVLHTGGKELHVNGYAEVLPLIGQKFSLKPEAGTTVVGKTGNDPLITVKNYSGGGKAVMFSIGAEFYYAGQKGWVDYAKQELKKRGMSTDQDIWKFTLPFQKESLPVFNAQCLSGNNAYWYRNKLIPAANRVLPGARYRFSLPPDGREDTNFIPFGKGNLMNRLEAPTTGDIFNLAYNAEMIKSGKLRMDMFADTWTKTEAFSIQFEFGENIEVAKLKIFWNGELPDITLQFDDGTNILFKGEKSEEVGEKILKFAPKNTAKMTLRFNRRLQGGKLTISEVEIWSSEKTK